MLYSAGAPCRWTVCHTHSLRSGTTLTRFILYQAGTGTLCCTQLGRPVWGQFATHTHSDQGQLTRLIYQAMTSGTATLCCTRQRGTVCHTHLVRSGTTLTRLIYIYIPGNDISHQGQCATLGWGTLQRESLSHTLSEIRGNSDKVYSTLTLTGNDIRESDCAVFG